MYEFLRTYRSVNQNIFMEVQRFMCLTEFNNKIYEESIRSEGFEQGVLQNLISLAKKGFITTLIAANEIGVPEKDFIELMESQK